MKNFDSPWVRILIVNFNSGEWVQRCVEALESQIYTNFEVVIVDNASTDMSFTNLKLPDKRFSSISLTKNIGFAAANNFAERGAKTPWIATLNPDAIAADDWLLQLKRATRLHAGIRMFGSTQLMASNLNLVDGFGDCYSIFGLAWRGAHEQSIDCLPNEDICVFSPCAAAALYYRESFEYIGGFDESFFCYMEDIDIGARLRLSGQACVQVRNAIVAHAGSVSSGRNSDFTQYHSYRNRIWLIIKIMPILLLLVAFPLHLFSLMYLTIRTHPQNSFMPRFRGIADGLRGIPQAWRSRKVTQRKTIISQNEFFRCLSKNINKIKNRRIVKL